MNEDAQKGLVFGGLFVALLLGIVYFCVAQDAREDQLIAEMVKAGVPVSEAILAVREVQ